MPSTVLKSAFETRLPLQYIGEPISQGSTAGGAGGGEAATAGGGEAATAGGDEAGDNAAAGGNAAPAGIDAAGGNATTTGGGEAAAAGGGQGASDSRRRCSARSGTEMRSMDDASKKAVASAFGEGDSVLAARPKREKAKAVAYAEATSYCRAVPSIAPSAWALVVYFPAQG